MVDCRVICFKKKNTAMMMIMMIILMIVIDHESSSERIDVNIIYILSMSMSRRDYP